MSMHKRVLLAFASLSIFTMAGTIYANESETKGKEKAEWTFLVYMEADNNLNDFAVKNLYDMARVKPTDKLNVLVQWNQPKSKGKWRYRVLDQKVELDAHIPADAGGTCVDNLVDAVKWAKESYPAKHYSVVLWNHGVGVIDPIWGSPDKDAWATGSIDRGTVIDLDNPRAHIPGISSDEVRGILFNESTRTYMNNQQMSDAFRQIKDILGQPVDLVGMDACLMAMAEEAYLMRDYAKLLVASQDVELADGWFYSPFLRELAAGGVDGETLAQSIVLSFEMYYKNKTPYFTQSAINLEHMDSVSDAIGGVVKALERCKAEYGKKISTMVYQARRRSLQFDTPAYIDVHTFFQELERQLNMSTLKSGVEGLYLDYEEPSREELRDDETSVPLCDTVLPEHYFQDNVTRSDMTKKRVMSPKIELSDEEFMTELESRLAAVKSVPAPPTLAGSAIENLRGALQYAKDVIDVVVIANAAGKGVGRAHGLSIYYPNNRIDKSYLKTDFANDSHWLDFLRDNI